MRWHYIYLFLLPLGLVKSWECGTGYVSHFISKVIAYPSGDRQEINRCCLSHDDSYSRGRREADDEFCGCLDNNQSWWTRNIVQPIFCRTVRLYTFVKNIWDPEDYVQVQYEREKYERNRRYKFQRH